MHKFIWIEPLKIFIGKKGWALKRKERNGAFYTTNNQHGTVKILDNRYLKVPKLKSLIKMKVHRQPLGR